MAQDDTGDGVSDDVLTDIGSDIDAEIKVVLDKWSVGQIGWPDVLFAAGIAIAAALVAYLARRLLKRATRDWEGPAMAATAVIGHLMSTGIYLFAAAAILEVLGFSVGPVVVLILLGAAIAIVLRPMVQNLGSGLALQLRGSCQPGDVVEIDGIVGVVDEVSTRAVVLTTSDGQTVYIPNSQAIDERLINLSRFGRRMSTLEMRVPATTDMARFVAESTDALSRLDEVLPTPAPRLVITGFDGAQLLVTARFWHPPGTDDELRAVDAAGGALLEIFAGPGLSLTDAALLVLRADPGHGPPGSVPSST